MTKTTTRIKFRTLLSNPGLILPIGIWDPFTARVAEWVGLKCTYMGGFHLGKHLVVTEPLLTLTEVANACRYITAVIDIPLVVDVGAGFGEPLHVVRTVREMERAGAAAIHIEDQAYPKRAHYHKGVERIISRQEMLSKIKAALGARTDPDFVIIGRTDAFRTHGFKEGVERANLLFEAGAEMVLIYPNSVEEARQAPREIKGPLSYTVSEGNTFGRPVFSVHELEDMGYKMATYPTTLLCPVMQELKRVMTNLMTTGESGLPSDKMTVWRKELEDLVRLPELYKLESETIEDLEGKTKGETKRR